MSKSHWKAGEKKQMRSRIARLNRLIEQGYAVDGNGQLVHRKVCRAAHGPFPSDWVVHHIDENKANNEPANLIAMPRRLHDAIHKIMRRNRRLLTRAEIEQALKCWRSQTTRRDPAIHITIQIAS